MERKFTLNLISEQAKKRFVTRGQVYKCDLGVGIGSEMQKERPCVIIQNNIGNYKSGNTFEGLKTIEILCILASRDVTVCPVCGEGKLQAAYSLPSGAVP